MIHPLSHETVVNPPDWHIEMFKFQFKVSLENHKNVLGGFTVGEKILKSPDKKTREIK